MFNGSSGHHNKSLTIIPESLARLANLEEIAAVDGVDGLFVGPGDLSAAMGHIGDIGHQEVQDLIARAAP